MNLYQIQKSDIEAIKTFMAASFMEDPLFLHLIPNPWVRERFLPAFFHLYLDFIIDHGEVYASSPALEGVATLRNYPETEAYQKAAARINRQIHWLAVKTDKTLRTLFHFRRHLDYLISTWSKDKIPQPHIHLEYLAVRKDCQGQGTGGALITAIIAKAEKAEVPLTLETHKASNAALYRHFGFRILEEFRKYPDLTQYNMVKDFPFI